MTKITFETPDGIEIVERPEGKPYLSIAYDPESQMWRIPIAPSEKGDQEDIEYRCIPRNRVYEVIKRTSAPIGIG